MIEDLVGLRRPVRPVDAPVDVVEGALRPVGALSFGHGREVGQGEGELHLLLEGRLVGRLDPHRRSEVAEGLPILASTQVGRRLALGRDRVIEREDDALVQRAVRDAQLEAARALHHTSAGPYGRAAGRGVHELAALEAGRISLGIRHRHDEAIRDRRRKLAGHGAVVARGEREHDAVARVEDQHRAPGRQGADGGSDGHDASAIREAEAQRIRIVYGRSVGPRGEGRRRSDDRLPDDAAQA